MARGYRHPFVRDKGQIGVAFVVRMGKRGGGGAPLVPVTETSRGDVVMGTGRGDIVTGIGYGDRPRRRTGKG